MLFECTNFFHCCRIKIWLEMCNRPDLLDLPISHIHNNHKVCEQHFEDKYIYKANKCKQLFKNALPNSFKEQQCEEPSTKIVVLTGEHCPLLFINSFLSYQICLLKMYNTSL